MKAKKQKLNFKPTPISRLLRYSRPLPMVGDPKWKHPGDSTKTAWREREKLVYAFEMERKPWPHAWKPELWAIAHRDNDRLDVLIRRKWDWYDTAVDDNKWWDHDEACRENAAWDYHHEYAPDLEMA